jgi:hypothetical protein
MTKSDLPPEIPVIYVSPGNAIEQVTAGLSDVLQLNVKTSRDRPYNGQSWTCGGIRGQELVHGLTMRDIQDCIAIAFLSAGSKTLETDEWVKCWDFSTGEAVPTPYLLERQNEPAYAHTKVDTGNWTYQDLYIALDNEFDPIAVMQCATCEIEKMMGIFPNIPDTKSINPSNKCP